MAKIPSEALSFPDPEPIDAPGDGVVAHWYRPAVTHAARNGRGIVILPIQGGDYDVSIYFAEYFAKKGYHTLRFERRAEWLDPEEELETLGKMLPAYVADVRRGIGEWLASAGLGDTVDLFGVSMGANVGSVVAGTDDRVRSTVLCIGGGPLSEILIRGRDEELDAWRDVLTGRMGGVDAFDAAAAQSLGSIDVLEQASGMDAARCLFVGSRFDRVVPFDLNTNLWEAIGRPRRIVLPCGHYSTGLFIHYIRHRALRWLDTHAPSTG